ncbi:MAG: hypothetical protein GY927_20985 [bacterium]|nr:hypothetical protein [bacterium]
MTNTGFALKNSGKKNTELDGGFDERSAKLMVQYFLEDEEYKDLLEDISKLSPASFNLIAYFLVVKDYH